LCFIAYSWYIGLGNKWLCGCNSEHSSHTGNYYSSFVTKTSSYNSTIYMESKSSFNSSINGSLSSLYISMVTLRYLFCYYTFQTCSILVITLFGLSQLFSIFFKSSLSIRLSFGYAGNKTSAQKFYTSQTTFSAGCQTDHAKCGKSVRIWVIKLLHKILFEFIEINF
jgi:hypothetical protein